MHHLRIRAVNQCVRLRQTYSANDITSVDSDFTSPNITCALVGHFRKHSKEPCLFLSISGTKVDRKSGNYLAMCLKDDLDFRCSTLKISPDDADNGNRFPPSSAPTLTGAWDGPEGAVMPRESGHLKCTAHFHWQSSRGKLYQRGA